MNYLLAGEYANENVHHFIRFPITLKARIDVFTKHFVLSHKHVVKEQKINRSNLTVAEKARVSKLSFNFTCV